MANRKKLRKRFFAGEVSLNDLTKDEAKYLNKYIRKMERDTTVGKEFATPTYKEVPCQKLPGKTVLVSVSAPIVTGEDGLLYVNEVADKNLIVSGTYRDRESAKKTEAARLAKETREAAVTQLAPTRLGEE